MPKLLRQNVGGTDYSMVGCALTATCATAAATAAKVATLTDGDALADGMSVVVQFTEGNTTAFPLTLTVGGVTANICDSRGQNIGGNIWQAGNVVTFLYTFGKFLLLNADIQDLGGYDNIASSLEDALARAFNAITAEGKTITGYFTYQGTFMCLAFKYSGGQYGMMLAVRNDGAAYTLHYYTGTFVVKLIGADSYEQTRYDPTINTTYVKDMVVGDGVSVYKTKNGLKVLTGYFVVKADLVGGITDLLTFPEACRQTRPSQLWITMVSVSTGKSYPLLLAGTQLGTWGSFLPAADDIMFIPPVTYL